MLNSRFFVGYTVRWNTDYYHVLEFHTDEANVPIRNDWWGAKGETGTERQMELYWYNPLQVSLQEQLTNDFELLPCWVVGRLSASKYKEKTGDNKDEMKTPNLRFALIRMRIQRVWSVV